MSLVEIHEKKDVELLRKLIDKYHAQGAPRGGGAARRNRYFVWIVDGFWCAGAWIHDSLPFRFIANMFMIPQDRSYFIRRVCSFCPGNHLVAFLNALCEKLGGEGWEALWTLGMHGHSNALYKLAGFMEIGKTPRTQHPVFVKWLKK